MKKRIHTIKQPATKLVFQRLALAILPALLFQFNSYGQIDPKKVDSLSRLIDSSAHAYELQQDSVVKYQDSANKSEVNKTLQQNAASRKSASLEQKRREQEQRQEIFVRIAWGVLVFVIVIIALMRRRKSKP